jgi:hypothetical protein
MSVLARERRDNMLPALVGAAILHAGVAAFFLLQPPQPPTDLTISAVPVNIVSDVPATAPSDLPDPPAVPAAEMAPAEETPAEAAPPPPAPKPPVPTPAPPKKLSPTPAARPVKPPPSRPSREMNADSILDSAASGKAQERRPARPVTPPAKAAERPGGAPNQGPISSTGQVALGALTRRLQENWILACDSGADKVVARVRFRLSSTGQLIDGPDLVDRQSGTVWQAAAERATRAVRASAPFTNLPDELLNRDIVIKFNGESACRGR